MADASAAYSGWEERSTARVLHSARRRALERSRRILGTRTETETIHRALDLVVDEAALVEALHRFMLKGRGHIEDVDARG